MTVSITSLVLCVGIGSVGCFKLLEGGLSSLATDIKSFLCVREGNSRVPDKRVICDHLGWEHVGSSANLVWLIEHIQPTVYLTIIQNFLFKINVYIVDSASLGFIFLKAELICYLCWISWQRQRNWWYIMESKLLKKYNMHLYVYWSNWMSEGFHLLLFKCEMLPFLRLAIILSLATENS